MAANCWLTLRADIDKEINADELKEIMQKQMQQMNPLHEVIEETQKDLSEVKRSSEKAVNDAKNTFEDREIPGAEK